MNKKAAFTNQGFIITLLLFIGVVITFSLTAKELSDNYGSLSGVAVSSDFDSKYNKLQGVNDMTEKMDSDMKDADLGTADSASVFYGNTLNAVKTIRDAYGDTQSIIQSIATDLHVPVLWQTIFIAIFVIMVVFGLIYMVFGGGVKL